MPDDPAPLDRFEAGRRLRAAREAKGLSQVEAARILGVAPPKLSEWERGRRVFDWTRLVAYVDALGLDWRIVLPEATSRRRASAAVRPRKGPP